MKHNTNTSKIIIEFIMNKSSANDLTEDTLLLTTGVLDSFSMMELIIFIEERFEISFTDEELNPEVFSSVKNINNVITEKLKNE